MSSLAGYLRELAQRGTFDFDDIVEKYESWVNDPRYMVLAHEGEAWLADGGAYDHVAVICAKRGNDVYTSRVASRLYGIGKHVSELRHDFCKDPYTSMLFVTLSYNVNLCSFWEAWQQIGIQWNLYRANLRKKYGKFSVFRTWESYQNGFPHIHAILIFEEKRLHVFPSHELNKKGELKLVWRIDEKRDLEPYWHSWQGIKAVYNIRGGLNYLKKYIMKCAEYNHSDAKGKQTLAMCWVFRKKAFYVSGQFRKALSDLIFAICSSKTKKIQLTLLGAQLEPNTWRVLGFVGVEIIGVNPGQWTILLSVKQISDCYAEWEQCKRYD
jgi:hypothetical protein